jgi:hypothetical protein
MHAPFHDALSSPCDQELTHLLRPSASQDHDPHSTPTRAHSTPSYPTRV